MTELYIPCYIMIFNVCTLISYYKKNKLFQFKKKKKYSLFNKINELMKSSTRVSNFNNLISLRSSTIFNSFHIDSLHSIENLSNATRTLNFVLRLKKKNLSSSTIATKYIVEGSSKSLLSGESKNHPPSSWASRSFQGTSTTI